MINQGSHPHTRRIRQNEDKKRWYYGITPAYAGNTMNANLVLWIRWDHPRIRGEYFIFYYFTILPQGSPPHTRGILHFPSDCNTLAGSPPHTRGILFISIYFFVHLGITPAYAGNTFCKKIFFFEK